MVIDSEAGKFMYRLRNADTSFLSLALALLVPEWRNGGRNSGLSTHFCFLSWVLPHDDMHLVKIH